MEVQFNRINVAKRASRTNDVLQNFMKMGQNMPSMQAERTSELLKTPHDISFLQKFKFKSDQQFRLMINLTIGRIYLYMVKIIEIYRITDKYSVKYHLVKNLVIKILDALDKIPQNLKGIFYSHSSFMTVIFKYQIEDILSNEANSIFQVFDAENPARVSINLTNQKGKESQDESVQSTSKSSFPFYVNHILSVLNQLSKKNQYYYIYNKLDIYKNSCDLDEFDDDFENIKKKKHRTINFNQNVSRNTQRKDSKNQNQLKSAKQKQKISTMQSLKKIFYKTSMSSAKFNKTNHQKQKEKQIKVQKQQAQNSIMKDRAFVIYFDNTNKQYKNPFNKSLKKDLPERSSLAHAGQIIQNINTSIYKKMNKFDSFTFSSSITSNLLFTTILALSFMVGLVGILLFENYSYRCGVLGVSSIGFISSIVYISMLDVDSEDTIRSQVINIVKKSFRKQPFKVDFEENKYHIKLFPLGKNVLYYDPIQAF